MITNTRYYCFFIFIMLLVLTAIPNGCKKSDPPAQDSASASAPATPTIHWQHDYQAGIKQAVETNKPILIAFHTDWCPPCNKMKKNTYRAPEVIQIMEQFVPIMLDADKEQQLSFTYNVRALPTYIFLQSDGKVIEKVEGFLPTKAFIEKLNAVLKKVVKPL